MIWTKENTTKRNRVKNILSTVISSITVLALIVSLIIFIPDSKPAKGASLFKTWTSYNDFNNNDSATAATTPRTQIVLNGSGTPTDAAAGTLTLEPNSYTVDASSGDDLDLTLTPSQQLTLSAPNTVISANVASGATSITVQSSAGIVAGDKILIMQMADSTSSATYDQFKDDTAFMGMEELNVSSVPNSTTINVSPGIQRPNISAQSFAYPSSRTQVLKIMEYDVVTLGANSSLYGAWYSNSTYKGGVLSFRANSVTMESGSKIYMSRRGYPGYECCSGRGPGKGGNGGSNATAGGGGGYGGAGGHGEHANSSAGIVYGSTAIPTLGSSGGELYGANSSNVGATGGGLIKIQTPTFVNNGGTILADGENDQNGGSGGGIHMVSDSTIDATKLSAKGGNASDGGGGGGGRILVSGPASGIPVIIGGTTGSAPLSTIGSDGDFSNPAFKSPGDLGATIGLRSDAGSGVKAKWSAVTFNSSVLASGEAIKFAVRTSDDGTTWSAPLGRDGAAIDWTTGTGNYLGQAYGESIYSSISGVSGSRYMDIVVRLSGGSNTPILNDVRLDYDVIDAVNAGNLSIYRNDGTTQISVPDANGGWTNETTVKVKADALSGLSDSSTVSLEVEQKDVGTAFDGTGTTTGTAVAYSGSPVSAWATLSGLTDGQDYHIRVRIVDNFGRASGWTNFNSNNTAFTVEQTAPTGSVSINSGAAYTTSTSVTLDLSSATDPGAQASGVDKVMASEDPYFVNASLGDTTWQEYSASYPFTLSTGDANKAVYVKFKDKAGNTTGKMFTSQTDWQAATLTNVDTTTNAGDVQLNPSSGVVAVNIGNGSDGDYTLSSSKTIQTIYEQDLGYGNGSYSPGAAVPQFNNFTINSTLTTDATEKLEFKVAGTLTINGSINVQFQGYPDNSGTGGGSSQGGAGASYGGRGGSGPSPYGAYPAAPTFGSGGGSGTSGQGGCSGGYGGGLVKIQANNLIFNGTIYAYGNGGCYFNYEQMQAQGGGGGSGGGVYILSNSASGSGTISAKGGNGGGGYGSDSYYGYGGGGGGGGRVTVQAPKSFATTITGGNPGGSYSGWNRGTGEAGVSTYVGPYIGSGTIGGTNTGLRLGSPAGEANQWTKLSWSGSGLSTTYKIRLQARAANTWGSGATGYMPLDQESASNTVWTELTSGSSGTINLTNSNLVSNATKTLEIRAELIGDGGNTPVLNDLAISYVTSDSITLDTTSPADVVETGGKTSVGFTDNTTTTEIANDAWTQDLTPYFSWGTATDPDPGDASQSGVSGYNVYFGTNASATAEVDGTFQAGTVYDPSVAYAPAIANSGNLPSGDQYYLKIIAKDTAGNFSTNSKDYTVKVDNTAPDVTSTAVSATTTFVNKVQVSWVKPPDDSDDVTGGGAVKYYVYWCLRDAGNGDPEPTISCYSETDIATAGRYEQTMAPDAIADITNTSFNDYSSDASYTYYFGIRAIDAVGNMSTSVSPIGGPGYISDTTPPSVPSSVSASALTGTSIQVNWTAASDNTGIEGYQVWYTTNSGVSTFPDDYTLAGSTSNTTYTQSGLVDYKEYYYRVRAYDADTNYGNINDPATNPSPAFARTPDITNPPAVSWVTANGANGYSATQNDLDWTAPTDLANDGTSPGSGISGYNIYISDQGYNANTYATAGDLPTPTFDVTPINGGSLEASTSISDTGLDPFMWYAYKIVAYDNAASTNASADSSTVWVRTKKDTQPVGASNLTLTTPAGDPSSTPGVGTQIGISFDGGASKNDVLDLYEVYRSETDYGSNDSQWLSNAVKVKTFTSTDMAPVTSGLISTVMYNDNDTASSYPFTDDNDGNLLTDNTVYYYKVRVVDTIAGEGTFYSWTNTAANKETADISAPNEPASIAVIDLYPKGLISSGIEAHPILMAAWPHISQLKDHGTSTDETFYRYRLYRSTDLSFTNDEIIYTGLDNFHRDEIVTANAGQRYYYKITSVDGTLNGGVPNESGGPVYGPIIANSLDKVAPSIVTRSETVNASSATINLILDETSEAKILFGSGATCSNLGRSVGTAVDTSAPSVELKKLSPNSTYSYRVVTTDSNDNKRTSACYSFPTPSFVLSSVEESTSVSSATLKWNANASANSFVKFTNTKTGATKTVANSDIRGAASKHSLGLSGLAAGTKYNYQLISMDEYSNKAVKTGSFTTAKFKATSVSVSTTVSSAIVTWKTNVSSDSFVGFGKKSISGDEAGNSSASKTHKVIIRNLKPGTKYKFRVKSRDAHDNIAIKADSDGSFTTKPFRISNVKTRTSTNSATITWTTNAASTSSVEYRSAADKVSQLSGDAKLTTKHSVVIRNLEDDTAYSYRIKSRDKEDNIAESKLLSFKTNSLEREYNVNPKVSDIDEMELSATSAKIAWTTAGATSSWVDYGTSRSLSKSAGNDTMTVDHIVEITNLTPGTLYYYRVRGEDEAGNKYQSGILTFTALVEPKIVEEAKVKPSNDSAVITWKTNTDTDSIVEYGLTDKYGDSSGSGALAKEHEVKVEGLAQDSTYNFRVGGVDKYSVKVMSANSTFKTSKDTTGPKIDDIRSETLRSRDAEGKEKISVIVNFTTNEEATSYVEYAEGITMATYNKKTRLNNTLNLSHSALIEGLKPATTYHYRIITKDRYDNTTKSMDKTILTPKESETVLQKIIKVLEETFSWVSNLRDYLNKKVSSFRK